VAPGPEKEPVHPPEAAAGPKPERPAPKAVDDLQSLLTLGASLTERADYESADIAFRQVLDAPAAKPESVKVALLGLAHMHRKQGTLSKAAAIYERYLKDFPDDVRTPDAQLDLGRTLRGLGAHKAAISRFYNVISSTLKLPGDGFERYQLLAKTAQFEIAETHFLAGDFGEATKFYTRLRLLDLAPADRARAHFKAAYSLRLQGNIEGAVTMLRAYVEQSPDDENVPEARYLLAISLRELKRPQEALAVTLELLRAEKARVSTDAKRWAYWQRRTGNYLANDFFESGDVLNARTIYAVLLDLSTDVAWRLPITYQLGLCYERLGLTERAKSSYQAVLEGAGPTPPEDFRELATMAKWRMEHLDWRDRVSKQVTDFFGPGTHSQLATAPSVPAKSAPLP
jgi:TolA-binding protein